MNIFSTRKDLMERVEALESQLAETESAMVEANKAVDHGLDAIKAKDEEIAALNERIDAAEVETLDIKERLALAESALAEATAMNAGFEERVNERATQILAASGHPPVEAVEQEQADILATYDSLKGDEKTVFFRRHESALRAAMRG